MDAILVGEIDIVARRVGHNGLRLPQLSIDGRATVTGDRTAVAVSSNRVNVPVRIDHSDTIVAQVAEVDVPFADFVAVACTVDVAATVGVTVAVGVAAALGLLVLSNLLFNNC